MPEFKTYRNLVHLPYSKKTVIRGGIFFFVNLLRIRFFAVNPNPCKNNRISSFNKNFAIPLGGLYDLIHVLKSENSLRLSGPRITVFLLHCFCIFLVQRRSQKNLRNNNYLIFETSETKLLWADAHISFGKDLAHFTINYIETKFWPILWIV